MNTHVQDNGKLGWDRKLEYFTCDKLPLRQSTAGSQPVILHLIYKITNLIRYQIPRTK